MESGFRMRVLLKVFLVVVLLAVSTGPAASAGPIAAGAAALPEYRAAFTAGGGTLLLSDSPEMVAEDGILYQDKVAGNVRLFFYHVNASKAAKRLAVVVENDGAKAARVTITRRGLGGPGYDYMAVGKEAMTDYLSGGGHRRLSIAPGGSAPLAGEIGECAVLPNMLINGIYDFTADQPVTVKVVMLPVLADGGDFTRKARVLRADKVHLRGTFRGADRTVVPLEEYDPLKHEAVAITLADNKADGYLKGIDATDGSAVLNYGNYGVVYRIVLKTKTKVRFGCYIAPRGGEYAGAVGVRYRGAAQETVATPQESVFFGEKGDRDFAPVGFFEGGRPLTLIFSPPGGSNMPVRLAIIPEYYY